jgi:hypothetical protein
MMAQEKSVLREHAPTDDRIMPMELVRLFARQWRWAAVTFVIVAFVTIVPLSRVKPQWEAQATVRIGQVYDALIGARRPIEPIDEILERMRVKSFLEIATKGHGTAPDSSSQDLLLESTKFQPIRPTDLIRITARGSSAEQATRFVRAILDQLRSVHEELARVARSEAELLAEEYSKELAGLREVQLNLEKAFSSATSSGTNDHQSALATIASAMEKNSKEMRDMERQRFLLIRRGGFYSLPTEIIGNVSSVRIASTSRGLVVVFGIVMGLAAGLVVAVLRDYFVGMRSQRPSG